MSIKPLLLPDHDAVSLRKLMESFDAAANPASPEQQAAAIRQQLSESEGTSLQQATFRAWSAVLKKHPEWISEYGANAVKRTTKEIVRRHWENMDQDNIDSILFHIEHELADLEQGVAEAKRKMPAPKFTAYPNYAAWRQELMSRGDDQIDHLDNDYVDNYRVLFAVDRNRRVVGMYYHTADSGSFVPPGQGFSDMIYYADTDPHWPYTGDDGREDLQELSKDTLGSYVKKASKDVDDKSRETQWYKDMWAGNYPVRGAKKRVQQKRAAVDKRVSGIGQAVDRLTKEGVAEGRAGVDDRDTVGFSVNSEAAYNAVMKRFGDYIDHDETDGIMYAPARLWPEIEMTAFDADPDSGAVRVEDDVMEGVGDIKQLFQDYAGLYYNSREGNSDDMEYEAYYDSIQKEMDQIEQQIAKQYGPAGVKKLQKYGYEQYHGRGSFNDDAVRESTVAEESERLARLKAARAQGKSMGNAYSGLKDLPGTAGKPSDRAAKLKAAKSQGKSISQAYSSLDDKPGVAEGVTSPEIKQAYDAAMKTAPGTPERKRAVAHYQKLRADALAKKKQSGVSEADKHSLIGKIQRGHELKKKVDQSYRDIGAAQQAGDKAAGSRAFRKHERLANLERPGTWTKPKDLSENTAPTEKVSSIIKRVLGNQLQWEPGVSKLYKNTRRSKTQRVDDYVMKYISTGVKTPDRLSANSGDAIPAALKKQLIQAGYPVHDDVLIFPDQIMFQVRTPITVTAETGVAEADVPHNDPNLAKAYRLGNEAYKAFKNDPARAQAAQDRIEADFPQYARMWLTGYRDGERFDREKPVSESIDPVEQLRDDIRRFAQ